MVLGSCLHDVLAWLYGSSGDSPELIDVLGWFEGRLANALDGNEDRDRVGTTVRGGQAGF